MTAAPELFRHYPSLQAHLPWTALARPTPVQGLDASADGRIWVKRDDRTSDVFGGHLARGLEFALGAAVRRGSRRVLAFGRAGSQRCLALTAFAKRRDLDVVLALWGRAGSLPARQTLQRAHELGAALYRLDGGPLALYRLGRRCLGATRGGQLPFVLWPRRANLLAALGNANAVYELQRQIRCGILPEPETLYVRNESPELLAGLLLGCELAGLGTRIVAEAGPRPRRQAFGLARRGLGFLSRHVAGPLPVREISRTRLSGVPRALSADGARLRALLLHEERLLFPDLPAPVPALDVVLASVLGPAPGPTLLWHAAAPPPLPVPPPLLPRALREFVVPS